LSHARNDLSHAALFMTLRIKAEPGAEVGNFSQALIER
jgi:hypothetical protein